jgi:hypothetical protein
MNLAPFTDRSAPSAILKGNLTVQLMTTLLGLKQTATKMQCYTTIGWERSNVWLNSLPFFLKLTITCSIFIQPKIYWYTKTTLTPNGFGLLKFLSWTDVMSYYQWLRILHGYYSGFRFSIAMTSYSLCLLEKPSMDCGPPTRHHRTEYAMEQSSRRIRGRV